MPKNIYQKIVTFIFTFFCAFFVFQSNEAHALTPIARVDVVPYQRIEHDTTFNFGVVAFSKEGIGRIEFTITGQGYSGGTKTATTMTHNPQTDVWEYWVPISSNEFNSNGPITITSVAYGEDAGVRNIGDTTLIVEGASAYNHIEAWVDGANSDGIGTVGDIDDPYPTIVAAVSAAQIANGGTSNGNIIYLEEGTYSLTGTNAITSSEWLTITKARGTTKESVIINERGITTNLLKVDGITLQSKGSLQYVINPNVTNVWVNDCRLIGSGRWVTESYPVANNSPTNHYSTNNYIYDSDRGIEQAAIARKLTIEHIGNDAFSNTGFVVDCVVKDVNAGPSGIHADTYQAHTAIGSAANNRIIYGLHATDIHMSGFFLRADPFSAANNAFVNVMIEMREPSVPNEAGVHSFSPFGIGGGSWDHTIIWHCSFPLGQAYLTPNLTNSSVVGNVFWQLTHAENLGNPFLSYASPGNAGNNDVRYNHFMYVYGVTESCIPVSADIINNPDTPCPHWYAKIGDSGMSTATTGGGILMLSNPSTESFGMPTEGLALINRIPFFTIPADIYGNPRIGNPDVGAVEYISTRDSISPAAPMNIRVL